MRKPLYLLAALLLPVALFLHLGGMVFIDDEAIRSLVAYEMMQSGNWWSPSMHADAYFNKPPLFNWVLAASFWLHGEVTEWAARVPTVLSLLGFTLTTYYFSRRHFPRYWAVVHALTVATCGRMLFWDSMLALIDVTFSWVVYVQVMLLYHHGRRGAWWRAFGWSYALTVVGFMLKGLPAIAFQGLTVLAILGWTRSWKRFFGLAHVVSGLGCLALLGGYYWLYSGYVDVELPLRRLLVESGKRTAVAQGLWASIRHVVAFPFEMSYHFLPWTILLVHFLRRGVWARLRENDFAAFCTLAFAVNIPLYWLSPNVYPRYLLMLFPLLFAGLLHLHAVAKKMGDPRADNVRKVFTGAMVLVTLACFAVPFVPELAAVDFVWGKALGLGAAAGAVVWMSRSHGGRDLLLGFAVFLLLTRVGFNLFVLPVRMAGNERGLAVRETAYRVAADRPEERLAIYGHSLIEPATGYYLTRARGAVIPRQFTDFDTTTLYIVSDLHYPEVALDVVDSLYLRHRKRHYPVGYLKIPLPDSAGLRLEYMDGMGSGVLPERAALPRD